MAISDCVTAVSLIIAGDFGTCSPRLRTPPHRHLPPSNPLGALLALFHSLRDQTLMDRKVSTVTQCLPTLSTTHQDPHPRQHHHRPHKVPEGQRYPFHNS